MQFYLRDCRGLELGHDAQYHSHIGCSMQTYPEERKVLMLTLSSVELDAHNLILVVLEDVPPLMMGRPAVTAVLFPGSRD